MIHLQSIYGAIGGIIRTFALLQSSQQSFAIHLWCNWTFCSNDSSNYTINGLQMNHDIIMLRHLLEQNVQLHHNRLDNNLQTMYGVDRHFVLKNALA